MKLIERGTGDYDGTLSHVLLTRQIDAEAGHAIQRCFALEDRIGKGHTSTGCRGGGIVMDHHTVPGLDHPVCHSRSNISRTENEH
jgi:hypothetical protein